MHVQKKMSLFHAASKMHVFNLTNTRQPLVTALGNMCETKFTKLFHLKAPLCLPPPTTSSLHKNCSDTRLAEVVALGLMGFLGEQSSLRELRDRFASVKSWAQRKVESNSIPKLRREQEAVVHRIGLSTRIREEEDWATRHARLKEIVSCRPHNIWLSFIGVNIKEVYRVLLATKQLIRTEGIACKLFTEVDSPVDGRIAASAGTDVLVFNNHASLTLKDELQKEKAAILNRSLATGMLAAPLFLARGMSCQSSHIGEILTETEGCHSLRSYLEADGYDGVCAERLSNEDIERDELGLLKLPSMEKVVEELASNM